jgi:hypothetical protein
LIDTAQDATPRAATASDPTGMISVTLGPDGLPKSFRVESDWNRHITPERLGQAVLDAFTAAMGERMAMWAKTLQDRGWQQEVDELDSGSPAPYAGEVPPAFRRPTAHPRSLDVVAEEMMRALDRAPEIGAAQERSGTGTGSNGSGALTLTLSANGLVSCIAERHWASRQSGTSLTNALGEALAAARADFARHNHDAPTGPNLNGLFNEAIALMNDPRRLMES